MIFLLRAHGKGTRGHQACSKQNRAQTHRVAKLHLSSRLLGALILWVRAGATQAVYPPLIAPVTYLYFSGLGRIGLILRGVNVLPLTALNPSANLRGRFSLARLFVGVQRLAHADVAH